MCRGYFQYSQMDLLAQFGDEFFERIETFIDKAAWSQARYVYHFLQPKLQATDVELQRFVTLKNKLEAYSESERREGTNRLTNWLKDSIQEITEMSRARTLSRTWSN
mmetsp:Transcript_9046/g.10651  ORF Transcript_9046/g.10651 Transcript_9046/m.10651 type:complete len:107 (+) Transcript_9046:2503-2823(+)